LLGGLAPGIERALEDGDRGAIVEEGVDAHDRRPARRRDRVRPPARGRRRPAVRPRAEADPAPAGTRPAAAGAPGARVARAQAAIARRWPASWVQANSRSHLV